MALPNALKHPFFVLIVQAACLLVLYVTFGGGPHHHPDSNSYLDFRFDGLEETLSQFRSPGYPLFLRLVRVVSPDFNLLPLIQIVLSFFSVFFFYGALRIYGLPQWMAFAAVTPLFYHRLTWQFGSYILTDSPGAALAITSVGFLFIVVARSRNPLAWVGLALSVLITWQVRPAYIFLVPLLPVLAVLLVRLREAPPIRGSHAKRICLGVLVVGLFPVVAYCGLRLVTVGHFGVASIEGHNLAGIATQFLTRDMVKDFDEDLRPLALSIIELRDSRKLGVPHGMDMIPMPVFFDYFMAYQRLFRASYREHTTESAARHTGGEWREPGADDLTRLNSAARRLAVATFLARPLIFLRYYAKAFLYGVSFALYADALIVVLLLALFVTYLVMVVREKPRSAGVDLSGWYDCCRELSVLILVSVLFFLAKLLFVIVAQFPEGRYMMAASIFIPSMLGGALYVMVTNGWNAGRSSLRSP